MSNEDEVLSLIHTITISISYSTFSNSFSKSNGLIYSSDNSHDITINNCTFSGNTGIDGEADIYYTSSSSFEISDTIFTLFTSEAKASEENGQSITILQSSPFSITIPFTNITVQCTDPSTYDPDVYKSLFNNPDDIFTLVAPIYFGPAQISITSSTFQN